MDKEFCLRLQYRKPKGASLSFLSGLSSIHAGVSSLCRMPLSLYVTITLLMGYNIPKDIINKLSLKTEIPFILKLSKFSLTCCGL